MIWIQKEEIHNNKNQVSAKAGAEQSVPNLL